MNTRQQIYISLLLGIDIRITGGRELIAMYITLPIRLRA
jgi:hypothetical protein